MRLLRLGQFDHALGGAHVGDDLAGAIRNLVEAGRDLFWGVGAGDEDALRQGDIGALEAAGAGRQDDAVRRRLADQMQQAWRDQFRPQGLVSVRSRALT